MEKWTRSNWHHALADPSGVRNAKPRSKGRTMVIDKGLGPAAFVDLLRSAGDHIDMIKLGFGTSALYPIDMVREKVRLAQKQGICIFPGGTFLELAVKQNLLASYFETLQELGFDGVEVSDGTIAMDRATRKECIDRGLDQGLTVFTEFGKKLAGSGFDWPEMIDTVESDWENGAELVTMEGRESGINTGLFDREGQCQQEDMLRVVEHLSKPQQILWETPLKAQQVQFIKILGPDINLGNIAPQDVIALEALRRGLRADTFELHQSEDMIRETTMNRF